MGNNSKRRLIRAVKRRVKRVLRKMGYDRPVLSIVIPVYNCEDYIQECLESVAASIESIKSEVIIVDDGSEDKSAAVAKQFIKKNKKFKLYQMAKSGVADARNYGLHIARGKYIGFVDADDVVREEMFPKLLDAAEINRADIAIIDAERFNSKGTWGSILHRRTFDDLDRDVLHITDYPKLVYDSTVWNKIVKRQLWKRSRITFPSERLYEDVAVSIPIHYEANRVAAVREIGYEWRNREGTNKSITQTTERMVNLEDRIYVLELLFDYANKRMKEETDIIKEMRYKFLTIDMKMFVDKSFALKDEFADEYRKRIKDFLSKHFTVEDYRELDEESKAAYSRFLEINIDND